MKIYETLILCTVITLFASCGYSFFMNIEKLNRKCNSLENEINANSFINRSFINTCYGKGYKDLNEWQVSCRKIYNLEYIAWCNAEDFMDVSYEKCDDALFYGIWKSDVGKGEVYCRYKK